MLTGELVMPKMKSIPAPRNATKGNEMESAEAIREMMDNWNKVEAAVRAAYPTAGDEDIYQITAATMNKSLGL